MININLNASEDWERVRRDTEPITPDVDRNPGTEDADRPELENGSHGLRIIRRRHRRGQRDEQNQTGEETPAESEESEAYEVDIGERETGFAPPPDGERAPLEPYQAQHVDLEA
jgi:hypothetical protein